MENFFAWLLKLRAKYFLRLNLVIARLSEAGFGWWKKVPVLPSITVSRAPPLAKAIVGVPQAAASKGTKPKSSSCGKMTALAALYKSLNFVSETSPKNSILLEAEALRESNIEPVPTTFKGKPFLTKAKTAKSGFLCGSSLEIYKKKSEV